MYIEAVRLTADAFGHATYGVNTLLASVPRFSGDALPSNLTVTDEIRSEDGALLQVPTTLPALVVSLESYTIGNDFISTDQGQGRAVLIAKVITGTDLDAADGRRNAGYYLRAMTWSMRKYNRLDHQAAARSTNSICLMSLGTMEPFPLHVPVEDTLAIAALRIPWTVQDYASF